MKMNKFKNTFFTNNKDYLTARWVDVFGNRFVSCQKFHSQKWTLKNYEYLLQSQDRPFTKYKPISCNSFHSMRLGILKNLKFWKKKKIPKLLKFLDKSQTSSLSWLHWKTKRNIQHNIIEILAPNIQYR
jgi:hypothetical protein